MCVFCCANGPITRADNLPISLGRLYPRAYPSAYPQGEVLVSSGVGMPMELAACLGLLTPSHRFGHGRILQPLYCSVAS